MADSAKWYVVHTYSGYENAVKTSIEKFVTGRNMEDMILRIEIPMENVTEITESGASKEVARKVFPGYVLIKMIMTDETWHLVRNVRGVTGFVGTANKAIPLTEEEVLEEVRVMSQHIDRLEGYVEAMAQLRRLEDVEVRRGPTSSRMLLSDLADTAEILRNGRDLVWTVHGEGVWNVDGEIVVQVCENLLTNAFRHSRSQVEVSVSAEGGALCVVVSDDGRGFSRRALERAMEPFYREVSGGRMGMGLHICKLLCERHGGDLSICNNAKGGGLVCASFAFQGPLLKK